MASIAVTALLARLGSMGTALSRSTLERLWEENVPRAALLLSMNQPRNLLGQLVALGQTLSIAVGAVAFSLAAGPLLYPLIWPPLSHWLAAAIFALGSLIIANIVPPYRPEEGAERPIPRSIWIHYPLYLLLLLPAILLKKTQNLFVSEMETRALKEEEFRQIVESETEEGTIEVEEREMIEGIFEFGDTTVKEVMVPRIDMVCAEISTPNDELLALIQETRHSRIPIYRERIDQIEGLVYVKDLLHVLDSGNGWHIQDVMRKPPYFVPENKNIDDLLREFKAAKVHMAIVVGEYGGTSGLVTLEDLIEEIVGEIQDEYDDEVQLHHWQVDGQVLIADARIDIEDLNLLLNVELPQDGYETLGGFIYNHLGHVPDPKETFEFENLLLSIQDVIGQRITTVRIEKREANGANDGGEAERA